MKSDTIIMIVKGVAFVGGAMFGAYQSGIAQWANENAWPSSINWHNIIAGVGVSACSALGAYLSGSVTTWRASRNGNQPTIVDNSKKP